MSDEQTQQARVASILQFIESLKGNKSFEPHRAQIRIVPKGLFIAEAAVDTVAQEFQRWLREVSHGAGDKSIDKTKQWLFAGTQPERLYLVEGKSVLTGVLVPAAISSPQRFALPYYLGSLLPAGEYLHPADPELQGLSGVAISQGRLGLEVRVARRDGQLLIPENILKSFRQIATESRFLQRRYPGCEKSLLLACKALIVIVRRARRVPRKYPIIAPHDVMASKSKHLRAAGKFLFVEEQGVVSRIIEMHGRHLSDFLRAELVRAPREKLGTFKLTPKHRDLMGFYEIRGRRVSVHARAFSEFAELIRRAREPRERFTGWFSAADCFERFASLYQLSQPIDKRRIAASLERFGIEGHSFKICGGWIFALSREGTLMRTVARHIRLPGHARRKVNNDG
ncbi:MAG: hypothetical protein ACK5GN_15240 [Pseudomonadota bacterium]